MSLPRGYSVVYMTTDEMVYAFRLRARGKTYDEIGELMNYEGHTINDTLSSVIHGSRHVKVVVSKNHPKVLSKIPCGGAAQRRHTSGFKKSREMYCEGECK